MTQMASSPIKNETDVKTVLDALGAFIRRRPGLEFANYGQMAPYRAEMRSIAKDRARAVAALEIARMIPARPELLWDAFRAFSGRLQWVVSGSWRGHCLNCGVACESPECPKCGGITTPNTSHGELQYTTGQYFPTEYRKAAASVLESYIAACKQADATANPRTFEYKTMEDVISSHESIGGHWFDRSTMKFFKTRIESRLIAGKRFITSECGPDERRRFTVREALPDGSIDTAGEFQQFATREKAKANVLMNRVQSGGAK